MSEEWKCHECKADNCKQCVGIPCHCPCELAPAPGSVDVLKMAERLVESAQGQVVVIIRHGDRIMIRDNSGIEGLTGETLMHKTKDLLEELFPQQNSD